VPYDLDLPRVLWLRSRGDDGRRLSAPLEVARATVTGLNDEHLFLRLDAENPTTAPETRRVRPGDVIGFGISHPCTLFDKWRVGVVVDGDRPLGLVSFDF
jgi:D-serine deaminase-like pyridoxal phosphate-dependent protein